MKVDFEPDQRHMAVVAFDELVDAGFIRPTYSDIVDPEAWVEITDNNRLLAVAWNSTAHQSIRELSDLSPDLVAQIEHFFVSYDEMKGKRFEVKGRPAGNGRSHW